MTLLHVETKSKFTTAVQAHAQWYDCCRSATIKDSTECDKDEVDEMKELWLKYWNNCMAKFYIATDTQFALL